MPLCIDRALALILFVPDLISSISIRLFASLRSVIFILLDLTYSICYDRCALSVPADGYATGRNLLIPTIDPSALIVFLCVPPRWTMTI